MYIGRINFQFMVQKTEVLCGYVSCLIYPAYRWYGDKQNEPLSSCGVCAFKGFTGNVEPIHREPATPVWRDWWECSGRVFEEFPSCLYCEDFELNQDFGAIWNNLSKKPSSCRSMMHSDKEVSWSWKKAFFASFHPSFPGSILSSPRICSPACFHRSE